MKIDGDRLVEWIMEENKRLWDIMKSRKLSDGTKHFIYGNISGIGLVLEKIKEMSNDRREEIG